MNHKAAKLFAIIALLGVMSLSGCSDFGVLPVATDTPVQTQSEQVLEDENKDKEPEYNYIYWKHGQSWMGAKLKSYHIINNGQNIEFEIDSTSLRNTKYLTSMENVELVYQTE